MIAIEFLGLKIHSNKQTDGLFQLDLGAISHLWTQKSTPQISPANNHIWEHVQINDFYNSYVKPFVGNISVYEPVIVQILDILDKNGDVPSRKPAEPLIFDEISLLEHVLTVTRNLIDILKNDPALNEIAGKYLIIGLGHSIAGIIKYKTDEDIANNSLTILDPYIANLPDKKLIGTAIKEAVSGNNLKTEEGKRLRRAIVSARQSEQKRAVVLAKAWGSRIKEREILDAIKQEFPNV